MCCFGHKIGDRTLASLTLDAGGVPSRLYRPRGDDSRSWRPDLVRVQLVRFDVDDGAVGVVDVAGAVWVVDAVTAVRRGDCDVVGGWRCVDARATVEVCRS